MEDNKLYRILGYLDDEMARYEDTTSNIPGDVPVSIDDNWREAYEMNRLIYEVLKAFEEENEELNQAKDLVAMKCNWYMRRYESYRDALREIVNITPEYFAKRTAEDALKLEQKIYEGKVCAYCEKEKKLEQYNQESLFHVRVVSNYNFCPMCGKARRSK